MLDKIKKLIFVMLVLLLMTGCMNKQNTNKSGQYVEDKITLPDSTINILDIKKFDENTIMMAAIVEDRECILWKSNDDGESWEECLFYPEDLSKSIFLCGCILEDGSVVSTVYYDMMEKADQEVDLLNESVIYVVIDENGYKEMNLETQNNRMITKFKMYEERLFACDLDGVFYEVVNGQTECINSLEDTIGSPSDFVFDDKIVSCVGSELVIYETMESETAAEYDEFREFYNKDMERNSFDALLESVEDEILYLGKSGLYKYDKNDKQISPVFENENFNYGHLDNTVQKLVMLNDKTFLIAGSKEGTPVIYKYWFDPNANNSAQTEMTIYTLYDSTMLQTIVDGFEEKNPDINVKVEIGYNKGEGITIDEAIRSLNISLFAENGPDVIVLDGLPVQSYLTQGALKNIKDSISNYELNENILGEYTNKGDVFAVPMGYTLLDFHATETIIENATSIVSLAEEIEKLNNGSEKLVVDLWEDDSIFSGLYYYYFPECFNEKGELEQEKVQDFLVSMKKIYDCSDYNWTVMAEDERKCLLTYAELGNMEQGDLMMYIDEAQLMIGELQDIRDIQLAYFMQENKPNVKVNYFEEDSVKQYIPKTVLAVSQNAKHSEEAQKFLEYAMSEEGQSRIAKLFECFPINETVFDQIFNLNMIKQSEYSIENRDGDEITIISSGITKADVENWKNIQQTFKQSIYNDKVIKNLVMDAIEKYVNEEKTLDEAVEYCVQRIGLYVNE